MRQWETGTESHVNSLQWKWELGAFQQANFDNLMNEIDGCLPVQVFEKLYNDKMRAESGQQ